MQVLREKRKGRKGLVWNPELEETFLDLYHEYGNIGRCAEMLKISPSLINYHRNGDPDFDEKCINCEEAFADQVELKMLDRALNGTKESVVYQGEIKTDEHGHPLTVTKHSDRLMELAMKAQKPDKYRERREITGANGQPFSLVVKSVADMIEEERLQKGLDDKKKLSRSDKPDEAIIEADFTPESTDSPTPSDSGPNVEPESDDKSE